MLRPFILACLIALASIAPARATSVLPLPLDGIVSGAAVAFEGTCVSNSTRRDPVSGLVATFTTFAVHDVLRGSLGTQYTIKQVGGELPAEGIAFRAHGVPTFKVGQDYVVFLPAPSSIGFSSPVGLSQGRFVVTPGAAGNEVTNGRDFRDMTSGIPDTEFPPGLAQKVKHAAQPVRRADLAEFKELVRSRIGAGK
ncbi:MAG TPA: hypothetical protein VFN08_08300 [Gemmatimonadales bacterium]|nr:hypothetical protein [Gemmatimonadales bacterium]